jgi:hypothetical protein
LKKKIEEINRALNKIDHKMKLYDSLLESGRGSEG